MLSIYFQTPAEKKKKNPLNRRNNGNCSSFKKENVGYTCSSSHLIEYVMFCYVYCLFSRVKPIGTFSTQIEGSL